MCAWSPTDAPVAANHTGAATDAAAAAPQALSAAAAARLAANAASAAARDAGEEHDEVVGRSSIGAPKTTLAARARQYTAEVGMSLRASIHHVMLQGW
jgi:hypothetical protein